MKYKEVKYIPTSLQHNRHDLRNLLEEFVKMDSNIIEIDPINEGYRRVETFQSSILMAIRRYGYKRMIRTRRVENKVYLIKIYLTEVRHD